MDTLSLICLILLLILVILMVASYKKRLSYVTTTNQGINVFYDFLGGNTVPFTVAVGGSGQLSTSAGDPVGYYPGLVATFLQFAADAITLCTSTLDGVDLVGKSSDFQMRLTPAQTGDPTIGTANNKRSGGIGFFNSPNNIEAGTANGVYFYWNGNTSNNFICKYVSPTTTDTFVTTHLFQREDLYLRIIVNPSASYFFINNSLVYTSVHGGNEFVSGGLNMPTIFGFKDYKIDNGANVGMAVDAIKFVQTLTTPRTFAAT
jgi:hypothetical protein